MSFSHFNELNNNNFNDNYNQINKRKEELYLYNYEEHYNEASKYDNPHDIINIKGLTNKQNEEVKKIKADIKMENEKYLREHKEIDLIINIFMCKLLDEKPDNVLEFAGNFFNKYFN